MLTANNTDFLEKIENIEDRLGNLSSDLRNFEHLNSSNGSKATISPELNSWNPKNDDILNRYKGSNYFADKNLKNNDINLRQCGNIDKKMQDYLDYNRFYGNLDLGFLNHMESNGNYLMDNGIMGNNLGSENHQDSNQGTYQGLNQGKSFPISNQTTDSKPLAEKSVGFSKTKLSNRLKNDKYWRLIISYLKYKKVNVPKKLRDYLKRNLDLFYLDDEGNLFRKRHVQDDLSKAVPVIPDELIPKVLETYHDSLDSGCHFGINKTLAKIKENFYFRKMKDHVKNYVKSCHECQMNQRAPKKIGKMKPILVESFDPFSHVEIDFIGKLDVPFTHNYVLVAVDKNSNFCLAQPTKSPDAKTVIKLLKKIINEYNLPKKISCDQGSHFLNYLVHNFCSKNKIQMIHSSTYSPQTQGLVERMNGVLKGCIKKYHPKTNEEWLDTISSVVSTYNSTPIEHFGNKSPFYLIHGYNKSSKLENELGRPKPPTKLPLEKSLNELAEVRKEIPDKIKKNADRNKGYYDRNKISLDFKPNDLVLLRQAKNVSKDKFKFNGPYRVLKKLSNLNYIIKISYDIVDTVHARRLLPYIARDEENEDSIPPKLDIKSELKKLNIKPFPSDSDQSGEE